MRVVDEKQIGGCGILTRGQVATAGSQIPAIGPHLRPRDQVAGLSLSQAIGTSDAENRCLAHACGTAQNRDRGGLTGGGVGEFRHCGFLRPGERWTIRRALACEVLSRHGQHPLRKHEHHSLPAASW